MRAGDPLRASAIQEGVISDRYSIHIANASSRIRRCFHSDARGIGRLCSDGMLWTGLQPGKPAEGGGGLLQRQNGATSRRMNRPSRSRSRPVFFILFGALDRPKPGFTALDPKFVVGGEGGRRIGQDTELDLCFVCIEGEHTPAAVRAKGPPGKAGGFSWMLELSSRPDPEEREGRATLLATFGAMADADPIGGAPYCDSYLSAKT